MDSGGHDGRHHESDIVSGLFVFAAWIAEANDQFHGIVGGRLARAD